MKFQAPEPKPEPYKPIPWRELDAATWAWIRSLPDTIPRRSREGVLLGWEGEQEFVRRLCMAFDASVVE